MDKERPSALQARLQARREMFMKESNLQSGDKLKEGPPANAQPIYSGSKQEHLYTNKYFLK